MAVLVGKTPCSDPASGIITRRTTSRSAQNCCSAAARPAPSAAGKTLRGKISLYGAAHAGKPTANGETFDPNALTMAHRTLPFGTRVRVTNLENQKSVELVVNDRGPFVPGRIADVSAAAARQLGMVSDGVVEAQLDVLTGP